MVPTENATNLMDCKENKRRRVTRSHSLIEYSNVRQLFWSFDKKSETRTSCDTWDDRRKTQQGKQSEKIVVGLTKVLKDSGWINKGA